MDWVFLIVIFYADCEQVYPDGKEGCGDLSLV